MSRKIEMSDLNSKRDIDVEKKQVKNAIFEFTASSHVYPRIIFLQYLICK